MLYYAASYILDSFGPSRLLQSYAVLIGLALFIGFLVTGIFLPKFYKFLPTDRGRAFVENSELAKGKPTGSGVVFISFFVIVALLCAPVNLQQTLLLVLVWLTMITGFLDDKSIKEWSELKKGLLDLIISLVASFILYYMSIPFTQDTAVSFWFPFITETITVAPWAYISFSTVILWASINTTNCTDGVDGLSSALVLVALLTMGILLYFVLGHVDIAEYLLVPHLPGGASWAIIIFALIGVLMGYLWHNAFPSKVLMGDAGSRALGFFIGVCVMVSGNPFLIFATSSVIFLNGGMGLLKLALLRAFKIHIFKNVRFPLHDHMKKTRLWSPTQVLVKFVLIQTLVTIAIVGIILKIR